MAANTTKIYPKTPNVGRTKISTTSAQVKSDGTSAGTGTDLMYCVAITGASGSIFDRIDFMSVASAANTTGVATTIRAYISTVVTAEGAAAGATTSANTFLIGEISVLATASSHSTNATNIQTMILNKAIPTGRYILVSQHVAQTTNQQWQAIAYGADFE